jgi:hypothetical protein
VTADPESPRAPQAEPSEPGAAPPRNPFRNEADAFRVLLMIFAAALVVIAVALLTEPLAGALAGLVLLGAGLLRTWHWIQAWRAWSGRPDSPPE